MRQRASQTTDPPRPQRLPTPPPTRQQPPDKRLPTLARRLLGLLVQGILVGLIAVAVVIFVAPGLSAYLTPQSYVYGDTETAVFIAWSEHNSQIQGVMHLASVDAVAKVIHSHTTGFTGLHDKTHVTITFSNLHASVSTVDGTLGWRSLRLGLPQSDGEIANVPLAAGELTDYDRAVQAIQSAHPDFEIQGD